MGKEVGKIGQELGWNMIRVYCIKYFKKKKSRGGKNKQMGPIKKGLDTVLGS